VEGSVKLGNRTLTADDLDYVPQFDDLNEFFTVSTSACNTHVPATTPTTRSNVAALHSVSGTLPSALLLCMLHFTAQTRTLLTIHTDCD
jgi:hypothetical protein